MRKKILIWAAVCMLLAIGLYVHDWHCAVRPVKRKPADLSFAAQKTVLSSADYRLLFLQTGLGRAAIDDLKAQADSAENLISELQKFQNQLTSPMEYHRRFLFFPITTSELLTNGEGEPQSLVLPPLHAGDILITKSTKTLFYRHGHAALVMNPEAGVIAESMLIGTNSDLFGIEGWLSYPSLLILRPKYAAQETVDRAVTFAREKLLGVPYQLLTGLLQKNKALNDQVNGTQCAHLVWQAYYQAGVSLDSDGSWLVTPHDLAASDELEIVFSYGFGEDGKW